MFDRILTATDIVSTTDAPVLTAARLAKRFGGRLRLLHVMAPRTATERQSGAKSTNGSDVAVPASGEAGVRRQLDALYRPLLTGIDAAMKIAVGHPWREILREAGAFEADLIVMGPHSSQAEANGTPRVAGRVGSTVEQVVTRETCPVMVVNRAAEMETLDFRRVLVAVDFSRSCECAVAFAVRLAARCGSRLICFHMLPVPPVPKYSAADYAADKHDAGRRIAAVHGPALAAVDHQLLFRGGALPHLEILNAAMDQAVDLIVMGSHTKEHEGKWYPGSAVERVAYRSPCPVMVITDPDALLPWGSVADDPGGAPHDRHIHLFTRH